MSHHNGETLFAWIVEYCDSIYESAPAAIGFYQSAVSAFQEMRRQRDEQIHDETWGCLSDLGYFLYPRGSRSRGDKPIWFYRIRKVEIKK